MRLAFITVFVAILACCGCGDGRAMVTGRITFNGEPVSRGSIALIPVDGKGQAAGSPVENGSYSVTNVLPGEKIVQISAVYVSGKTTLDGGLELDLVSDLLPASWGAESTERLVVTAPRTTHDYEIKGPDPRKK